MARVYYWYIPTANIFRHAYVYIYICIQTVSLGRVFSQSFENWYVNILWNGAIGINTFLLWKNKMLFSKCIKWNQQIGKESLKTFCTFNLPRCSPVCGGLWSSCTYCLWQHSRHCFSLPCQSAIKGKENNQCLSGIPQPALCVPSASEHLVTHTCWRIFPIFHTFQEPVPQHPQNANLWC